MDSRLRGNDDIEMLAERTGLAYMPQAAESLASDSLRVPNRTSRRGSALVSMYKEKAPDKRGLFL
jgi:hypothetical protein